MLRISAYSSRELLGVLRGLRNLDRDTKKHLRQHLRPLALQAWQETLGKEANSRLEGLVLARTGRAKVSDQNVTLTSATLSRSLSGGLKPSESFGPVEFGANRQVQTVERRNRQGTTIRQKRDVHAPFKKPNRQGYVVYPSFAKVAPRILAMYVQTFARGIHEALEGKSNG